MTYQEYLLTRLNHELEQAKLRQKPNQSRKSGYIRGLEKAVEIINSAK